MVEVPACSTFLSNAELKTPLREAQTEVHPPPGVAK